MPVVHDQLRQIARRHPWRWGPNGTFVALRPLTADAEVIVVTNWLAELKAKAGKK